MTVKSSCIKLHDVLIAPNKAPCLLAAIDARTHDSLRDCLVRWSAPLAPLSAEALFHRSILAHRRNHVGHAQRLARNAILAEPDQPTGYIALFMAFEKNRLRPITHRTFDKILKTAQITRPLHPWLLLAAMRLHVRRGHFDLARDAFQNVPAHMVQAIMVWLVYLASPTDQDIRKILVHLYSIDTQRLKGARALLLAARQSARGRLDAGRRLFRRARSLGFGSLVGGEGALWGNAQVRSALRQPAPEISHVRIEKAPVTRGGRPVAVVSGNAEYLDAFLPGFAKSLRKDNPETPLHVHAIGPLSNESRRLILHLADGVSLDHHPRLTGRTYYTCARFIAGPSIQNIWSSDLIFFDIDSRITGNIQSLFTQSDQKSIGLCRGRPDIAWEKIDAYVVLVRNSPAGWEFLAALSSLLHERFLAGGDTYYMDQGALFSISTALDQSTIAWLDPSNIVQTANESAISGKLRRLNF